MNISINDISQDIKTQVEAALYEDIRDGDITASLIPADKIDQASIITRETCTLCGTAWVTEVYRQLGACVSIDWHAKDGDQLNENDTIATLHGNSRALLTGERTALNFLQLLSATASKAVAYKTSLGEANIKLLDTRKTIPGLRTAQKYAVAVGGCDNHRIGLYDAFLIKENHILACGSIDAAVSAARTSHPDKPIEVEVEDIPQLKQALEANADIIMLDNFSSSQLEQLQDIDKGKTKYEVSGNLTIDNIAILKPYNIDYISFGALTKHVKAVDLSFRIL